MNREGTDDWPVTIRSERVVMRCPDESDREAMIRLMTDPVTREYLGGAVDYASRQALELSPLGLTWGRWAIAETTDESRMIGSITLDYDRGELQLSYALLPESTGRGLAAEACLAVLQWAQDTLQDDVIIAVTQTRNRRSVALLQRLGFHVRKGLTELGAQQLMMARSLEEPLPAREELAAFVPPFAPPGAPTGTSLGVQSEQD